MDTKIILTKEQLDEAMSQEPPTEVLVQARRDASLEFGYQVDVCSAGMAEQARDLGRRQALADTLVTRRRLARVVSAKSRA